MKLDSNEVKSINEEFKKPDLGEVTATTPDQLVNSASSSSNDATVSSTQVTPSATTNQSNSLESSDSEDLLSNMLEQNAALNAQLLVALDDINKGNYAVKESIDRMFQFMWDEKYAPKPTTKERKEFVPDSKSKEDQPGDGKPGEGMLDGILGDLLGLGAAAIAGKSALGTIFGRNKGAPTSTAPKSRGRIGGWVDKIRGKTPTPAPTTTTVPQTAAKQGKVPTTVPTNTPNTPNAPTRPAPTSVKPRLGGRMALIAGAGAAAYAGYDWVSSKFTESSQRMDENRFITLEERQMQSARIDAGLPMLEGQDLIDYRTDTYGRNGILVNPKTGFPLSERQADIVRSGKGNAEYASTLTNDQAYELLSTGSVTATPATESMMPSVGELATVGAGMYVAKKATDVLSPTVEPTSAPTTVGKQTPITTTTTAAKTTPSLLARAPLADNITRQKLPSDTQLKAIKQNITNVSNAADTVEAEKVKGVKLGKALPVIGTAMTVYDAANVITDDTLTTGQKAGELTDIAGGTAGAILGAKGGASAGAAVGAAIGAFFFGAGAVPGAAIGAAIGGIGGGIAGYMGGSAVTKSAREWLFGDDETGVDSQGQPIVASATPIATSSTTVSEQTENAFNSIVEASKPINNSWISNATAAPAPVQQKQYAVGVGVMKPGVATPSVISQPQQAASNSNVFAQAATATPSASISSVAPEPVQTVRESYQPIKETYVVNNNRTESATTVAAKESKSRVEGKGVGSNNTAVTRIDEVSPIISDGGLGFLNAGVF